MLLSRILIRFESICDINLLERFYLTLMTENAQLAVVFF